MKNKYDLIIIGGGAAGLGAAQYAARANLETLVIEEMAHGGQALLIDKLENYPGILEPIDGYGWSEIMKNQAENFGAEFGFTTVNKINKLGKEFQLDTDNGVLSAKAVIVATGAKHRHLGAAGEEELSGRGVSYCATCDGPFFKGKRILVVGGGDAACDEAMFLSKLTDKLVMIHRKDRFRAQKALAARVLANPKIEVRFDTVVESIKGDKAVETVSLKELKTGKIYEEAFSAVFIFVGSIPQTGFMPEDCAKDDNGYLVTDENMETNIKGLFAAGDVRTTPFRQVVTAVSDGAIAAHSAAKYIDEIEGQAYGHL